MQTRFVLPDRTVRQRTATRSREQRHQASSSPGCRHVNSIDGTQTVNAEHGHSSDDWYHAQSSSTDSFHRMTSSISSRSSIRRNRKRSVHRTSRWTHQKRSQRRQSPLPYVESTTRNYVTRWSDDEDSDFVSTDTHSDSSSDADDESQERTIASAYAVLSRSPGSTNLLPGLLDHARGIFSLWRNSAQYVIPPYHRQYPRRQRQILLESHDPATSTTLITPIDGYYPLACPFSRSHHCAPLPNIPKLIRHLHTDHREPIYCPVCGSSFPTFRLRDEHARAQTCQWREHFNVDGVDDRRLAKIVKKDDPCMDEEGRWRRIWGLCFPGKESPSPWITEGPGLELTMVRDWWAVEGKNVVKGSLEEGHREWEDEVVDALVVVLGGLLEARVLEG